MMKSIILIIASSFLIISCLKDKTIEAIEPVTGPCADTVSFSSEIVPEIINLSCNVSGCHDATASAGYEFTTYNQISTNANAIYSVINHESGFVAMPYFQTKLADSLIQKMDCWIQQGALDN